MSGETSVTQAVLDLTELAAHAGQVLGQTSWRHVTQNDIDAFARLTGDTQWIHVDPERAKTGPFGTTIGHGYFTLALSTIFLDEVVAITGANVVLNYGSNRVRYPAPVPAGSRIRATIELPAVEDIAGGVQATFRLVYEVEGQQKPACVADIVYRYYRSLPGSRPA
jgi:acyl dehydratase